MRKRVFFAYPITPGYVRWIIEWRKDHEPELRYYSGIRHAAVEALHITALYIGEIEDSEINLIIRSLDASSLNSFALTPVELHVIPTRSRENMIWLQFRKLQLFENNTGTLRHILSGLHVSLPNTSHMPVPHITLARFRSPSPVQEPVWPVPTENMYCHEIVLFRSVISAYGAKYSKLFTWQIKDN